MYEVIAQFLIQFFLEVVSYFISSLFTGNMKNIILNTFKEIVRNKFLYLILFFAAVFIAFSILIGKLTIGDDNKVVMDFGLSMIEIFGIIGVLFVGSQLLFKEIEGKTIFLILSKPIKRYEFVLGKFFGFSMTIGLIVLLQSILFLFVLFFKGIEITELVIFSLLFTYFKLEILLALVFFFSSFMSTILTILVSIMIYILSHSFSLLLDMVTRSKNMILTYFAQFINLAFPPFEALNIKDVIGSLDLEKYNFIFYMSNTFYSLVYLSIILYFTIIIFNKKEFE